MLFWYRMNNLYDKKYRTSPIYKSKPTPSTKFKLIQTKSRELQPNPQTSTNIYPKSFLAYV